MAEVYSVPFDDKESSEKAQAEHVVKMHAKVDESANAPTKDDPTPEPAAKPEGVPDKFWDAEKGEVRVDALLKSYQELESGRSKSKPEGDPKDDAQEAEDTARAALDSKGLDFDSMASEFAEKGELSADTYKALEEGGIPRHIVDSYIDGQKAAAQAYDSTLIEHVGGKESWDAIASWAADNLPDDERSLINEDLASGNLARAKRAVRDLKSRYEQTNGSDPQTRLEGSATGAVDGTYESWAQVKADMKKPEYRNDHAFRAKVQRKLGRSAL